MRAIDTNVVVRILTGDDPRRFAFISAMVAPSGIGPREKKPIQVHPAE